MDWLQVLTIAGSTVGACWYFKRDSDAKFEKLDDRFNQESKDFHGRMCTLEERHLQMMQRILEKKNEI